jgi:hypothetical protein
MRVWAPRVASAISHLDHLVDLGADEVRALEADVDRSLG